MQAKDREIALFQQQWGKKVSDELLIKTLYPLSTDYEYYCCVLTYNYITASLEVGGYI